MIEFDINILRTVTLNKYIQMERTSRYIAGKAKKQLTNYCAMVIRQAMVDGERFDWPCSVVFTWYLPDGRIDPDNWAFTQKFVFDGMQKATLGTDKFLENDNVENVRKIEHVFLYDKEKPRLEIRGFNIDEKQCKA